MTQEQLIEELLMEASGLGIRQDVLDASEKYIDQGMDRLDALEAAFSDLTDIDDEFSDMHEMYDIYDEDEDDEDWSTADDEYFWGEEDEDE